MAALLMVTFAGAPAATASTGLTISDLTIARAGYVKAGLAYVTATLTCSEQTDHAETGLEVSQRIHGLTISANQYGDVPGGCGPTPRTFEMSVETFEGIPYHAGRARATVWIFVCDEASNCDEAVVTVDVVLRGRRG